MFNMNRLEQWLNSHTYTGDKSLAEAQSQQTKARVLLTIASLTYVILHGEYFDYYRVEALAFSACYFIANVSALIRLRHKPFGIFGTILYPLLDVAIVTFGMLIDGGHSSGVYFMLLVIIIGNGLRFGNPLLIFAQVSCLIGMSIMTAYGYYTLNLPVDSTLLFWQVFTLIAVPFYVYLIGIKLEKAIKGQMEAEKTSFTLLDKGPLPVFTFEMDEQQTPHILYANAAIDDVFKRDQTELIGEQADIITLPEDADEMISFCRATFNQQQANTEKSANSIYIRGHDKSGNILKLMCTAIRTRWRHRWIGVCFIFDITERETMQEELEAVHRQGYMSTLVAGIVHDFRNVLTNVIGYAEVLQMNSTDATAIAQLEAIIAAGDRGSELITHLLKLSKSSEAEHFSSHTEGNLIVQPLENIIGLARLQLPQHVQLICQIDQPLHDVSISIIEIEQMLLNLINNAMQAIDDSGLIQVHIGHDPDHPLSQPGFPCMRITVKDNGDGISPDDLDKIFKPFWTSRSGRGGSGLGLTMVQRIIKRCHGRIEVESEVGQGSCFNIHIPPHLPGTRQDESRSDDHMPIQSQTETAVKATEISACHVLMVDDVPDILKIHQAMLARMGHSSMSAECGKDALELFLNKDNHFDLIITDYRMPMMDGLELVENIRQLGSSIPVLMVTAFGEDKHLQRAAHFNVKLMNKPVTMDKLKGAIIEVLSQ